MPEYQYPTRFCPFCGHQLSIRSVHCESCGMRTARPILEHHDDPFPWSPLSTYLITGFVYGVFFIATIVLMLYYIIFFGIPLLDLPALINDPLFIFLGTIPEIVFAIIPISFVLSFKIPLSRIGIVTGGVPTFLKDLVLGIGLGIAMVPMMLGLAFYELITTGIGPPLAPPGPNEIFWLGMMCLAICLVVAPAEELLFRGFVQNTLDAHYGNLTGLLVSSVIFGLIHANPFIGVVQTIGGIFLGLLFQKRGRRLIAPISAHATYDCLLIILDVFLI